MQYFLSEEHRGQLLTLLRELGISEKRAERVSLIPEGLQDAHLYAHAQMCVQYADQAAEGDEKAIAFLAWSAACIAIIGLEAHDRGMTEEDFPIAKPFMDAYSAKIEAEQRSTIH
jgi:hypothetical protein